MNPLHFTEIKLPFNGRIFVQSNSFSTKVTMGVTGNMPTVFESFFEEGLESRGEIKAAHNKVVSDIREQLFNSGQ